VVYVVCENGIFFMIHKVVFFRLLLGYRPGGQTREGGGVGGRYW